MNEIFVARNAFALTFTSSAVAKSVPMVVTSVEQRRVHASHHLLVLGVPDPNHESVWAQRVLDREAFAQELWVPRGARTAGFGDATFHLIGSADWDRGLANHQRVCAHVRCERIDRAEHLRHVRGIRALLLWRSHADEVHVTPAARLREIGGEPQPTGRDVAIEHLIQAGLVERHPSRIQDRHLLGIDVNPDNLEPEFGHARRMRRTEVPRPNHH
mgnify:CR=1 FL=1